MIRSLGVLVLLLCAVPTLADDAQRWSAIRHPAPGLPRVVGAYTAGCIQGAVPLPAEGPGLQSMRRQRQRFFGHPTLIHYLHELGSLVARQHWGVLSIGDLGQARGGPTPYGHRSHQTGLDADIWFWLAPSAGTLTAQERETMVAPSMLTADRRALNPQYWTPQHAPLLHAAAAFPGVERIFVHPLIKYTLCQEFPNAAWLRKVRPWWGHDDHFHVRLGCPADATECLPQESLPAGTGCDASLAWWFSEEAQQPPKRSVPVGVRLPAVCEEILHK
jgi:penicillin-insensitive murein endopeptidase